MVNIINAGQKGGGFRHYSGLLPANPGDGNPHRASVKLFYVPATNAATFIGRGDIAILTPPATGGNIVPNVSNPGTTFAASVAVGGGGSGLGNAAIAPVVTRKAAGVLAANALIAGVVVGFGPISLGMAKNGYQYIPANQEAWVYVETDPNVEMYITQPVANESAATLGALYDILDNGGQQSLRFGISGMSLGAAPVANTLAAYRSGVLRLLSSGEQIGNDVTATGNVAKVTFNPAFHFRTATPIAPAA